MIFGDCAITFWLNDGAALRGGVDLQAFPGLAYGDVDVEAFLLRAATSEDRPTCTCEQKEKTT
jgi:hypothetical protein